MSEKELQKHGDKADFYSRMSRANEVAALDLIAKECQVCAGQMPLNTPLVQSGPQQVVFDL